MRTENENSSQTSENTLVASSTIISAYLVEHGLGCGMSKSSRYHMGFFTGSL